MKYFKTKIGSVIKTDVKANTLTTLGAYEGFITITIQKEQNVAVFEEKFEREKLEKVDPKYITEFETSIVNYFTGNGGIEVFDTVKIDLPQSE